MSSKSQNPGLRLRGLSKIQKSFLIYLGLFLLAFLPRAYDLHRFVTADEAKWVYRSAQFLLALLRGDFSATSVNLTPAVTTTWLGSLGLAVYYQFNQSAIGQPFVDWLAALPEFRVQLDILAATRWPMVVLTSLSVVIIFALLRRLFNPTLAFLAATLIALDPHPVALSRIIGHDAPAMVFMSLSLLLLLLAVQRETWARGDEDAKRRGSGEMNPSFRLLASSPLILSAVAAGLAFLSKAPTLFLIPFAGLVLIFAATSLSPRLPASSPHRLIASLSPLLVWLVVAYLTFVAFWPAAWVEPLGRPVAVFQNAFISATDEEEASEEGFWRVPDLGPFYYVVNGAFKLSPLVMVGAGLAIFFAVKDRTGRPMESKLPGKTPSLASSPPRLLASPLFWLAVFVVLFTLFMTASDKRSPRYILPIFPPLAIIAAWGWLALAGRTGEQGSKGAREQGRTASHLTLHASRFTLSALLLVAALVILLPYAPYYFTFYNPLLGGPFSAPHLVKIGWGEGLDQVGRFLQREDFSRDSRVGTAYASTVAAYFEGDLSKVTEANLDYVVLYVKQIQSGEPAPEFIRYFEQTGSIFSVELNGIHYADVYPGPALQLLTADRRPIRQAQGGPLTVDLYPIGFRPLTKYGHIGETLEVDVVWQVDESLPVAPVVVSLIDSGEDASQVSQKPALAQAEGQLTALVPDLIVSHHRLLLPAGLTRGLYSLWVESQLLGEIELRHFQIPAELNQVQNVIFGQQIALAGYQFEPTADYLGVTIAWQAQTAARPDYTVFTQILAADTGERLAGVDTPPLKGEWPTSRWVKNEVVVDEYLVAIPPGFPPGYYQVIVGLYQPETGQRLTLADGQDHWLLPWTFIRK
ncbi:MAG: hypothetical protein DPW09_04770 [Anaerolineae bacterium]|nr:glycosyltransferase family 39 protein [Anaerolineales bacterium]MCQ3972745.1 hypothetical protein [Anaerolineae bacterium]